MSWRTLAGVGIVGWIGCAPAVPPPSAGPTWHQHVAPIVAEHCGGCHQDGGVGGFPLTTYDDVVRVAAPVRFAVETGEMPPWQPGDGCAEYVGDTSLPEADRDLLLAWIDAGSPVGDPTRPAALPVAAAPFVPDLAVQLPEPYAPAAGDDYRCQIVPWPLADPAWITGLRVEPDQRALVHHTIVFAADGDAEADLRALDAADPGPGYACYGGPTGARDFSDLEGLSLPEVLALAQDGGLRASAARWLGAWVPGADGDADTFPEGTGLRIEPGELLIVQMHYNSAGDGPADQSSVAFRVQHEPVEREAFVMPATDLGWVTGLEVFGEPMTIPAGASPVTHEALIEGDGVLVGGARDTLGLPDDAPLTVHAVGHHMHRLGTTGRQEIRHADDTRTCLLELPEWDFSWQGAYRLAAPARLAPEDALFLSCTWDNSAQNQAVVDGTLQDPVDVAWGEGTSDEMCLSTLYVTGP